MVSTVNALPAAPDRADGPTQFNADAKAFSEALVDMVPEINAVAEEVEDFAGQASSSASAASAAVTIASAPATGLSAVSVPTGVNRIATTGYSTVGKGIGTYISDTLADAALAAAHPRFCKATSNSRYFRLLPDADGFLSADAAGIVATAAQDDTTNHRTALDDLRAYAEAIGAKGIQCGTGHYSIWCPLRTYTNDNVNLDQTGIPFVHNTRFVWKAGPGGTTFNRRTSTGADPNIYANTQQLAANQAANGQGMPWRGGMFFLNGLASAPADYRTLPALTLQGNWRILGGIPKSDNPSLKNSASPGQSGATPAWYELDADGKGWDITDKPIWARNDRYTGDIVFDGNIKIDGFRGELLYQGGANHGSVYQRGTLELSNTDGDGINPCVNYSAAGINTGTVQLSNVWIHDCYQAYEGWLGTGGFIAGTIEDCVKCGAIQGGKSAAGTYSTYYAPGRMTSGKVPKGRLDLVLVNNTNGLACGSFLAGRIVAVDSGVSIGESGSFADGARNCDLDITLVTDQTTRASLYIVGNGSAGEKLTDALNLRVHSVHTDVAIAASRKPTVAVSWAGSLGANINIHMTGAAASRAPNGASVLDYSPRFTGELLRGTDLTNYNQNVQTTPAVALRTPVAALFTTGASIYDFTLPTTNVSKGQQMRVVNANSSSGGTIQANGHESSGYGIRMTGWLVLPPGLWADMEFDGTFWTPVGPVPNLPGVRSRTSTAFTFDLGDTNTINQLNNASAIAATVPPASSVNFPIGTSIDVVQMGAGVVTIVAGAGVTLQAPSSSLTSQGQYSQICLTKVQSDIWVVDVVTPTVAPLRTVATTTYAFGIADTRAVLSFTSGSSITATIPLASSVAFPIGATIDLIQSGAGIVTVAATGGVTLQSRGSLVNSNGQYSQMRLTKIAGDTWVLSGDRA